MGPIGSKYCMRTYLLQGHASHPLVWSSRSHPTSNTPVRSSNHYPLFHQHISTIGASTSFCLNIGLLARSFDCNILGWKEYIWISVSNVWFYHKACCDSLWLFTLKCPSILIFKRPGSGCCHFYCAYPKVKIPLLPLYMSSVVFLQLAYIYICDFRIVPSFFYQLL